MNELGYNQLIRALNYFGFQEEHKISISKMEEVFKDMTEETLRKKAYLSQEELNFINYRFGLNNGKVKRISEASKTLGKSEEEVKNTEINIVKKIKRYIELNFKS